MVRRIKTGKKAVKAIEEQSTSLMVVLLCVIVIAAVFALVWLSPVLFPQTVALLDGQQIVSSMTSDGNSTKTVPVQVVYTKQ